MNLVEMAQGLEDRSLPAVRLPLRDSIDTARGYRMIDEAWTSIPDTQYPWDPNILRLIREFAPDTVPLWRLSVFYAPNTRNVVVFGRHALGRHIERPGYELTPFHCSMPSMPCLGTWFKRPNKVWFVHEGARNRDYPDIPGTYLPFDTGLLHRARASVANLPTLSDKEFKEVLFKEMVEEVQAERDKTKAALMDDLEQRNKEFMPYAQKLLDRISDVEREEYLRSVGKRERSTKPMIHVNGDYPRGE